MAERFYTHALLIEAAGAERTRVRYGLSASRLCKWRREGIPWTHRAHFAAWATPALAEAGLALPDDFLTPPDLPEETAQAA